MRRAAALVAVVACALLPAVARGDGDPASDVLIKARVFEPYYVKLPAKSTRGLRSTVAAATKAGYPVRVALILHNYDLGSAGVLYRRPQIYAKFLAQELANFNSDWLVVVMPNGYGVYHCVGKKRAAGYTDPCEAARPTGPDEKLLRSLPAPERSRQDLAAAGDVAVRRLAALHGAKVGGGGGALPLVLAVVVVALLAGATTALLRRRARSGRDVA